MVTYRQLLAGDAGPYYAAADTWRATAQMVRDRADDLVAARNRVAGVWEGSAADAAYSKLTALIDRLDATHEALASLDQILVVHADGIKHAQAMVHDAESVAEGYHLRISSDGTVTSPDSASTDQLHGLGEVSGRLAMAVQYANDLDIRTVAAIAALLPAVAETMVAVDPTTIPREGADPRSVIQWWNSLSPAQQRWLVENEPDRVGRLDGVPAEARDIANRLVLERVDRQLREQSGNLRAQLDALVAQGRCNPEVYHEYQTKIAEVEGRLKGVEAIERRLDQGAGGDGRGYLLLFDNQGNGHVVLATGNPDTADNVATYVPGTGAKLAGVSGDILRADLTARTANLFDPTKHAVGVLWLGFDAPQSIVPEAMDISYAHNARDALSRFQDGLRITHDGPASHNTVIGHSYGSTVVGVTAHDRGIHADDVVFVGSPGVSVDHATDLGLNGDHVWSTHLGNDPIQGAHNVRSTVTQSLADIPRWGPLAPVGIASDFANSGDHLLYGTNPDAPAFGGQHFTAQDGSLSMHAHSEYWNQNKPSLTNMGYIVAGKPNEVERVKP